MNPAHVASSRGARRRPTSDAPGRRLRAVGVPCSVAVAVVSAPFAIAADVVAPERDAAADPTCGFAFEVRFVESAPRDRFELDNLPVGDTAVSGVSVALTGSVGELVFDTADGGTGVEVFQPFRVEDGEDLLSRTVVPEDGGERVELAFEGFAPGERFVFSVDVDDRLASSELGQIRVTGSEIAGASVTVSTTGPDGGTLVRSATFGADARAVVAGEPCAE